MTGSGRSDSTISQAPQSANRANSTKGAPGHVPQALSALLEGLVDVQDLPPAAVMEVTGLRADSRAVQPGDVFVAVPGAAADGRRFIPAALERGARAVITEARGAEREALDAQVEDAGAVLVTVDSARRALALMAARHHGAAEALRLTGVTGTNGKTTVTHLVEGILAQANRKVGLIGTVAYRHPGARLAAPLTTPGPLELHALLRDMLDAGCSDVVLEASSHALSQDRLYGCRFQVAALTNLTQDHLDYHGTMEAYFEAKAILFSSLLADDGVAVVHTTDEVGPRMAARAARAAGRVLTVAADKRAPEAARADVAVTEASFTGDGIFAELRSPAGPLTLESRLVGDYNLANLALAVGVALAHDIPVATIEAGIAAMPGVPGRLEVVRNDAGVLCVVDYAHTPDALERALRALRPLTTGRLLVVFGCGGDRDTSKRPLMGRAGAQLADLAIVTSDNPRSEDPGRIIDMIVEGVAWTGARERSAEQVRDGADGYHVEPDRRAAIALAVAAARAEDVLLIAGKGHEDYQILGTNKVHFDDREEAAQAFASAGQARVPNRGPYR